MAIDHDRIGSGERLNVATLSKLQAKRKLITQHNFRKHGANHDLATWLVQLFNDVHHRLLDFWSGKHKHAVLSSIWHHSCLTNKRAHFSRCVASATSCLPWKFNICRGSTRRAVARSGCCLTRSASVASRGALEINSRQAFIGSFNSAATSRFGKQSVQNFGHLYGACMLQLHANWQASFERLINVFDEFVQPHKIIWSLGHHKQASRIWIGLDTEDIGHRDIRATVATTAATRAACASISICASSSSASRGEWSACCRSTATTTRFKQRL